MTDDPVKLAAIGARMNNRLIQAIAEGYQRGEDGDAMALFIYGELCKQPERQTSAQAMAGIFQLADLRQLHRPFDRALSMGSTTVNRVCNHCIGPAGWPCTTATYLYTAEELQEME